MQPILVAYGTTEGHTRTIAEFIAQRLRGKGHEAQLIDSATPAAEQVSPVYAGAVLAGSLHQHRHQSSIAHFARSNAAWLNAIPIAFVSVSLSMAGDDPGARAEAQRLAQAFVDEAGLQGAVVKPVAGALKYTRYDFFKRWVMRTIAGRAGGDTDTARDHEYTDWDDLGRFVDEYAAGLPLAERLRA